MKKQANKQKQLKALTIGNWSINHDIFIKLNIMQPLKMRFKNEGKCLGNDTSTQNAARETVKIIDNPQTTDKSEPINMLQKIKLNLNVTKIIFAI